MHVRMMKALVVFVTVCVGNCVANAAAENDPGINVEAFKTSRIKLGDEELFIVTADDGAPLTTIAVFRDEGYEIELTPDGRKCRLSQVSDSSSCFEEAPLADDGPVVARISDRCKGREIVTLKPKDCNSKSEATTREKRCVKTTFHIECGPVWFLRWECKTVYVKVAC